MSKPVSIVKAEQVVPGTVYFLRGHLVTIQCTDQPGWLRGYVDVQVQHRPVAYAYATVLDLAGNVTIKLELHREGNDWVFKKGSRVCEVDHTIASNHLQQLKYRMLAAEAELDKMRLLYNQLLSTLEPYNDLTAQQP